MAVPVRPRLRVQNKTDNQMIISLVCFWGNSFGAGYMILLLPQRLYCVKPPAKEMNICSRKKEKKICLFRFLHYLCTRKQKGSLAQLVQSICLTSRGSAVRIRQLPQSNPKGLLFLLTVEPLKGENDWDKPNLYFYRAMG